MLAFVIGMLWGVLNGSSLKSLPTLNGLLSIPPEKNALGVPIFVDFYDPNQPALIYWVERWHNT